MLSRVWTLRYTFDLTRAHTGIICNMLVARSGQKPCIFEAFLMRTGLKYDVQSYQLFR